MNSNRDHKDSREPGVGRIGNPVGRIGNPSYRPRIGNPSYEDIGDSILGRVGDPSYEEIREARLTAYALGQLDPEERAAVDAALASSPTARRNVEEIRSLAQQVREASRATLVPPSSDLRVAVESRLSALRVPSAGPRSAVSVAPFLPAAIGRRNWRAWVALATAVCVLGAAAGLYLVRLDRGRPADEGRVAMKDDAPAGQPLDTREAPAPEKATERNIPDDAKRTASEPPKRIVDEKLYGWRPHRAAPPRIEAGPAPPTVPEPPSQIAVEKPSPPPGKPDSRKINLPAHFKTDKLAGQRPASRHPAFRGMRHLPEANPGFLGPGIPMGPVYTAIPAEIPPPPPAKKPKRSKDAAASGPRPFGAGAGTPGAADPGSDGSAAQGEANDSKHVRPGETNLAMPMGMQPDRRKSPATDEPPPDAPVENDFLPAARFPFSAFSLEVDRSTYADVDRFLRAGRLPPPHRIQVEDLVNYFHYDDPPPAGTAPFALVVEGAACPWAGDHRLVRIAVVAREASAAAEPSRTGQEHWPPVARDVRVQLEFNPALVASYRLIGYDGPPPADPKAEGSLATGWTFTAGQTVAALYELVPAKPAKPVAAVVRPSRAHRISARDLTVADVSSASFTVRLRYRRPHSREHVLLQAPWSDCGQSFEAASADFRFAAAVAAFGMALRGSAYRGEVSWGAIERIADAARGEDPFGQRRQFADLVRIARQLAGGR